MVFVQDHILRAYKLKAFPILTEATLYANENPEIGGEKKRVFAMEIHPSGKRCFIVATLEEF